MNSAPPITLQLTPAAEKFILRMVRFGGAGPHAGFRLEVSPGGCSGMTSQFSVESAPKGDDQIVMVNGIKLFVPPGSCRMLAGVTIDFVETATQAGLAFLDPNATACCDTGNSRGAPQFTKLS